MNIRDTLIWISLTDTKINSARLIGQVNLYCTFTYNLRILFNHH